MSQHNIAMLEETYRIGEVFTPQTPIQSAEIFSGRQNQLKECIRVVQLRGAHGAIFGDRGIGKTSISNILNININNHVMSFVCSCDGSMSFEDIWKYFLSSVPVSRTVSERGIGFNSENREHYESSNALDLVMGGEYSHEKIKKFFVQQSQHTPMVIIIDEYDRLPLTFDRTKMADFIKFLSDRATNVTIFIVGVGENISDLIGEHPSIERNIVQIHIPVMTQMEIYQIIDRGLQILSFQIDSQARKKIYDYSGGFPYFAHLLAYHCCFEAASMGVRRISQRVFARAVGTAITGCHQSLRETFAAATRGAASNRFVDVMGACAYATPDEAGWFRTKDVEKAFEGANLTKKRVNEFSYHISSLCTEERGKILTRRKAGGRYVYKFSNPLMRAFIRLKHYQSSIPIGALGAE